MDIFKSVPLTLVLLSNLNATEFVTKIPEHTPKVIQEIEQVSSTIIEENIFYNIDFLKNFQKLFDLFLNVALPNITKEIYQNKYDFESTVLKNIRELATHSRALCKKSLSEIGDEEDTTDNSAYSLLGDIIKKSSIVLLELKDIDNLVDISKKANKMYSDVQELLKKYNITLCDYTYTLETSSDTDYIPLYVNREKAKEIDIPVERLYEIEEEVERKIKQEGLGSSYFTSISFI